MLLALCLMLSLLPAAALAAEGSTKIEATTTNLTAGIYYLEGDVTLTSGALTIPVGATVTIDLKGHSLTGKNAADTIVNNGTLTIKDSGTGGVINGNEAGHSALLNNPGGIVTMESGKLNKTNNTGSNDYYVITNHGTMTINGGEIVSASSHSSAIENGWFTASANTSQGYSIMTINDATVAQNGTKANGGLYTLKNDDYGIMTINGGTFTNTIENAGTVLNWNDLTIHGGTFNARNASVATMAEGSNGVPSHNYEQGKTTITGGTFTGFLGSDTNYNAITVAVTGGTFSSQVSPSYLPLDYECVANEGDSTYTVQVKTGLSADSSASEGTVSATVDGNYSKGENDEDSVTEANSTLTIDATNETSSNITTSNVTVSANALTSVTKASVSNVAIKTDVGTLTVDKAAWDKITSNATSEEGTTSSVVLSIAKTGASTDQNTPLTYTLTAKAGDEDVFAKASAAGKITVSVPYTKTGDSNPQVYYVSANGSENMNAVYTTPTAEGDTGTLSWDASHFSTYVVIDGEQEAMLTTTSGTTYTTLSEALTSAATSGGTITLLKDVTLDSLNTTINSDVVISGEGTINATVATGATTVGLTIAADKSLTLDGVKLIINGTKDADTAKGNNGTALSLTSGSNLKLENGATLELKDLERGIIMPGTAPVNGTVTVDNSTLTASVIDGNFSNGGKFVFQNGSTATIDGCGSYGISANGVMVDNSTLTVKNTGYSAIYASDDNAKIEVTNNGKIQVEKAGSSLPIESKWSKANSPIDLGNKANGELTVDKSSSITLTDNKDKDSSENNSIYLSNTAILDNKGTITGEIKTAEVTDNTVRITYLVDGQTYYMTTATPESGKDTVSFTEPTAPTKSGYRFLGWGYGQNVTVTSGTVTLTPAADTNTYTFTAQWSKNSSGGGGVTTYAVTTNSPANGTVTVSPKSAAKDATVTITVAPASGYQLDKLTVVDKDGKGVALTDKGNGKYTFTMPASKVEVTTTFKQAPATHVCPAEKYTDVDTTQWYHEGVDYVIANGMMNGTGTNTFEPNSTTTRGMIVTILYRLEKEPAAGTSPFTDVDVGQWYAKAVAWAAANGVVNGTSPTTFHPNDPITREQMAAILYRYASFKGYDVTAKADLAGFTDAAQISAYAKDAMSWANKEGLIGGVSATTLQPQGSAIRAQVATILMRFCENVVK